MKNEESTQKEEINTIENTDTIVQIPFWKRNIISLILLSLFIIAIFWGSIQNSLTTRRYDKAIKSIKEQHEHVIQNLKNQHQSEINDFKNLEAKKLVASLGFAVRSEMIAENKNQIDQYFIQSLKDMNIQRAILVDSTDNVILSTNKKDEGSPFEITELLEAKGPMTFLDEDSSLFAATPIMGLNSQLGILIIEMD
ncbi:MAG: hypothetical protein M9897_04425 [Brumimicrobium sp.]|nr:hypothetical protein [Brumimicrobium sp.]